MLMKQSPGLGKKYAEFYSLIFFPDFHHICQIWHLVQEAMQMNKIIFIMKEDPKEGRAIILHRYYNKSTGLEAQYSGENEEEFLGVIGRGKVY